MEMRQHFPSTGRVARAQYPQTNRALRLKREIVKMRLRVLTRFPRRASKNRAVGSLRMRSIRLKFLWFFLFTERTVPAGAVSRSRAAA